MGAFLKSIISPNPVSLTLYTILLVILFFLSGIPILDLIELKTYDLRFRSRGQLPPSPAIVLAVIDEKSIDAEGRWPWPRSKIAALVDVLSQDGAKVIGFDIGFVEPDENSHLAYINHLSQKVEALNIQAPRLADFIDESRTRADHDLALANAIKNSSAEIVLGYFFHMTEADLGYRIEQSQLDQQINRIKASKYPRVLYKNQEASAVPFFKSYVPESNLEVLTKIADSSGYFSLGSDADGVVRWMPLIIQAGEDLFPPLALLCAWHYLGKPQLTVKVEPYGVDGIQMGTRFIPTNERGQLLINYLGPPKTFPHISISDILGGKVDRGTFKDKIVLVAATAKGIYDIRYTPFSTVYPGVEIHATVIDNLLTQNSITKPQWSRIYDLLVIILLGAIIGLVLPRVSAIKGLSFAVALFIVHIVIARWLFFRSGVWLNLVYPLLALSANYTVLTVYYYLTEERERQKIKGVFSFYVSSSVANEMLKDPKKLKLGGAKKDLSVLFSDIRGFTTIAEGLSPEGLVHLLNEYHTVMTGIVFKYEGTLDKYIGDATMAIYGAPLEVHDHPQQACRTALAMMEGLKELNDNWIKQGKEPLDIGIGINTGMMMVGNMGSEQRFDYTVMGDAVNLGSRLEGANKNYKTNILLSEFTYERVKDDFVCMELDCVRVKGKTLPVKIYQLVGDDAVAAERSHVINDFHNGLKLYKMQKFDDAIDVFQSIKDRDSEIYSAGLYIQRSQSLKANPPAADWDGVFTMTTK